MPRGKPGSGAAKPHSRSKLNARVLSIDEQWASGIEQKLVDSAHPWQADAIRDPARRITLLVGRGGGKTTVLIARALIKMTRKRRAKLVYVATSRPMAEEITWGPLKDVVERLGLTEDFEFNESKLRCTCKRTGSTFRLYGAENKREIDKLRGQSFDEVQIDEGASHDARLLDFLINRIIGPRLGNKKGCIIMTGTPGHILSGLFYDATRIGSDLHRPFSQANNPEFAGRQRWSSHYWTLRDVVMSELTDEDRAEIDVARDAALEGRWNEERAIIQQMLARHEAALAGKQNVFRLRFPALAMLWLEALVEKEAQGWSDDNPVWRREYLGQWAADDTDNIYKYRARLDDGTPWNQWDPERIGVRSETVTGFAKLPEGVKDWLFGYGLDLGSKDPFALNVFAVSASDPTRKIRHVYGFERRKMYARTIAELLVGSEAVKQVLRGDGLPEKLGGLFGLTGWPAAIVADLAGLGEALIDELANVYGIQVKAAQKKDKHGAIEVFNGDLIDGHMMILAGSPLEQQLSSLQWRPDEYGQPKEDKSAANHSADSAIYIRTELGVLFSGASPPPKDAGSTEFLDPQGLGAPEADDPDISDTSADEFGGLLGNDDYGDLFG